MIFIFLNKLGNTYVHSVCLTYVYHFTTFMAPGGHPARPGKFRHEQNQKTQAMKNTLILILMISLPYWLNAQEEKKKSRTNEVQKETMVKPVKSDVMIKSNLKPVQAQPAEPEHDPEQIALQRAYYWLGPFKNYNLLTIEQFAHLKTLDLSTGGPLVNGIPMATYFADDSLVHLLALKELESLNVPRLIGDQGLAYVRQLPSLKKLYMSDANVNDASMQVLGPLNNLETLVLSGTNVTNNFMSTLSANYPNILILNIGGTAINDAGLAYLQGNGYMENLILSRGNFTDASIPVIMSMGGLKLISVEFTQISAQGREQLRARFPNATIIPSTP